MDSNIARWAQIVWWEREDIEGLHHREVLLATRSGPSRTPKFAQTKLGTWEAVNLIQSMTDRIFPDGYWPREMTSGDQMRSMEAFQRAIYPIWMGIAERDMRMDADRTIEEVTMAPVMYECLTMHRQDLAIIKSGHKPSRLSTAPESLLKLRRKAAAGESYGKWQENG